MPDRFASGRHAGIIVPLFSIPSRASWGIGEIADLPRLARWLDACALDIVQPLFGSGHDCKFDDAPGDRSGPWIYEQRIGPGEVCDLRTKESVIASRSVDTHVRNQSAGDPTAAPLANQA